MTIRSIICYLLIGGFIGIEAYRFILKRRGGKAPSETELEEFKRAD
jgi:hypothetical protein